LTRAVDEALANIICHAYDGRPGQPIELCAAACKLEPAAKPRTGLEIVLWIAAPPRIARSYADVLWMMFGPGGWGCISFKTVWTSCNIRAKPEEPASFGEVSARRETEP
jgi:hypothetical protein